MIKGALQDPLIIAHIHTHKPNTQRFQEQLPQNFVPLFTIINKVLEMWNKSSATTCLYLLCPLAVEVTEGALVVRWSSGGGGDSEASAGGWGEDQTSGAGHPQVSILKPLHVQSVKQKRTQAFLQVIKSNMCGCYGKNVGVCRFVLWWCIFSILMKMY